MAIAAFDPGSRICSPRRLDDELDCIRKIFANIGYPQHVVNRTIRNALNPRPRTTDSDSDVHFIYMKSPWIGENRSEAFEKLILQATKPAYPTCRPRVFFLFPSLLFHLASRMPSVSMINLTLCTTLSAGAVAGI